MTTFSGLIKACEACGVEFRTPPSQAHVRACSVSCGYKIRKVANKKGRIALTCKHCGKEFFERECHAERRVYCSHECRYTSDEIRRSMSNRISGEKNPGWRGGVSVKSVSGSGIEYRRAQKHIENERLTRRNRAKAGATPAWASISKMRDIYRQAKQISKTTGLQHHVDHIVPLTSNIVCGLHNEFNLRVIPAIDNLKKHNRYWPDMP